MKNPCFQSLRPWAARMIVGTCAWLKTYDTKNRAGRERTPEQCPLRYCVMLSRSFFDGRYEVPLGSLLVGQEAIIESAQVGHRRQVSAGRSEGRLARGVMRADGLCDVAEGVDLSCFRESCSSSDLQAASPCD